MICVPVCNFGGFGILVRIGACVVWDGFLVIFVEFGIFLIWVFLSLRFGVLILLFDCLCWVCLFGVLGFGIYCIWLFVVFDCNLGCFFGLA